MIIYTILTRSHQHSRALSEELPDRDHESVAFVEWTGDYPDRIHVHVRPQHHDRFKRLLSELPELRVLSVAHPH